MKHPIQIACNIVIYTKNVLEKSYDTARFINPHIDMIVAHIKYRNSNLGDLIKYEKKYATMKRNLVIYANLDTSGNPKTEIMRSKQLMIITQSFVFLLSFKLFICTQHHFFYKPVIIYLS
jgi:hypothetical protein